MGKKKKKVRKSEVFTLVKCDKNLIEAEWKFFTLNQRKIFWYIAKRMQELGYTKDSLKVKEILTPIETEVLELETGKFVKEKTSQTFAVKVNLDTLYAETNIGFEETKEAFDKFEKTSMHFIDKENKKRISCSVMPRVEWENTKNVVIYMYAELMHLILELQYFISMNLFKILSFRSKHTLRFYELLNKVKKQNYPEFEFTLEEFNKAFDTNYKNWYDIKRKIIEPAKKELDEKSHITFEMLEKIDLNWKKRGKKPIKSIKFFATKNTPQPILF